MNRLVWGVFAYLFATCVLACPIGDGGESALITTPRAFIAEGHDFNPLSRTTPAGVLVDDQGQVTVLDSAAGQVRRLNPEGKEMGFWGRKGREAGELWSPLAIARDQKAQLFIADTGNHRIQVFDDKGRLIRHFGQRGSGDGQLLAPAGIAVDAQYVYVADTGNHRVAVFQKNGRFVRSFGAYGDGAEHFNRPMGVVTDGFGNLYIADSLNHRIQHFSRLGKALGQFGSLGEKPGQLHTPVGLSLGAGVLWVSELGNHRAQAFSVDGTWLAEEAKRDEAAVSRDRKRHYPAVVAVSRKGDYRMLCAPMAGYCEIARAAKTATPAEQSALPRLDYPERLAVQGYEDSERWEQSWYGWHYRQPLAQFGNWLVTTDNERHQLRVYRQAGDALEEVAVHGQMGMRVGQFATPAALAMNKAQLFVADAFNHRIQVFDWAVVDNQFQLTFKVALGRMGKAQGELNTPSDLQLDGENLYVLDALNHRVQMLNVKSWHWQTVVSLQAIPADITQFALAPMDGALQGYFSGESEREIYHWQTKAGFLPHTIGGRETEGRKREHQKGRLKGVADLVVHNQSLWAVDYIDQSIQRYDLAGHWQSGTGQWGSDAGEFYKPKSIVIDQKKSVVADFGNYRLQQLPVTHLEKDNPL